MQWHASGLTAKKILTVGPPQCSYGLPSLGAWSNIAMKLESLPTSVMKLGVLRGPHALRHALRSGKGILWRARVVARMNTAPQELHSSCSHFLIQVLSLFARDAPVILWVGARPHFLASHSGLERKHESRRGGFVWRTRAARILYTSGVLSAPREEEKGTREQVMQF